MILIIHLDPVVPNELRRRFAVARGMMLYGWFFYPLHTLAGEQLLRVAEAAVARHCRDLGAPISIPNFNRRLDWLSQQGELTPNELEWWHAARQLRNLTSHAEDQDIAVPGMVISLVAQLAKAINALFKGRAGG